MSETKVTLEVLARRAISCKRWRWMGGMQVVHTPRRDGQTGFFLRLSQDGYVPAENEYPDLSDPATIGCLLALVREHYPDATTRKGYYRWEVYGSGLGSEPTEAAALVAALEAAP